MLQYVASFDMMEHANFNTLVMYQLLEYQVIWAVKDEHCQ